MVDEIALVCIGVLIGALAPFIAGWVAFDRSVHEMTLEARTMREESEELRKLAEELAAALDQIVAGRASAPSAEPSHLSSAPVDESIYSVSVQRELTGRERAQALVQPSYFQGR